MRFYRNGQAHDLSQVPNTRTLLQLLREDLAQHATKEGCAEGDCGACTVVLGDLHQGRLRYRAINSCIRLAHSIDGMALWTAVDIDGGGPEPHPVQAALHQAHASQCGFCTPGFAMSLFALYQNTGGGQGVDRARAQTDLSGNLCRCTGYRPILQAAVAMATLPLPAQARVDEAALLHQLKRWQSARSAEAQQQKAQPSRCSYLLPETLEDLLRLRAQHPKAQLVAGCTDVGLWVTKQLRQWPQVLDLTRVAPLQAIETYPHHIAIGAAVTLQDAFGALGAERPQLHEWAQRFAGLPVRNAGTLGGNLANGSPIGDAMPLLLALGASLVLMRWVADPSAPGGGRVAHREMPLDGFYTGYRKNRLRPSEVLAWIKISRPLDALGPAPSAQSRGNPNAALPEQGDHEWLRVYKISKRFDDDISAICLAIHLRVSDGRVTEARLGVGGVAATPVRARRTEALLRGQPWSEASVRAAMTELATEFEPLSDLRASAGYRRQVLANLLLRCWHQSLGTANTQMA